MLSETWETGRSSKALRTNLFRSLSQIILAMARVHLPRIGSFRINDRGYIRLENRPITLEILDWENEKIPLDMPRDRTYETVTAYIDDLISCHDSRLRYQPNAVNTMGDCASQMCALVLMRTLRPHFFDSKLNQGPFAPCLTDLSPHNILVDRDWNITCIVDLEWTAALPLQFIRPPHWLTSEAIDEINIDQYNQVRQEFCAIFQGEERKRGVSENQLSYLSILNDTWDSGTFWYVLALQSPTGLHSLVYDRIMPHLDARCGREFWASHQPWKNHDFWTKGCAFWNDVQFYLDLYPYWTTDAKDFIRQKVREKQAYDENLRKIFDQHSGLVPPG